MTITHISKSGNVSIPKKWRDELGIEPGANVMLQKEDARIIIEPLKKAGSGNTFKDIDDEMRKKRIIFTRQEAIDDDLYN